MRFEELRELFNSKNTVNQKVRNAVKIERDGIKFDSKLEMCMYDLLKLLKIPFQFQKQYVLQTGFRYNGEAIRPITYTVDFYLPDHDSIIDTKGVKTQQGVLRIKMLKKQLADEGLKTNIYLPSSRTECMQLVNQLRNSNDEKKR